MPQSHSCNMNNLWLVNNVIIKKSGRADSRNIMLTMAALRGQLRALSNDRNLRHYVLQATPTGISLGTGSYGSVEEVRPCVCVCGERMVR